MKKFNKVLNSIIITSFVLFVSCNIEPYEGPIPSPNNPTVVNPAILPVLTTIGAFNVTGNTASSGGIITADGGSPITARGVVWSTNQNPTIADAKTVDGIGIGSFVSSITSLISGTTYYVRSYATNTNGTSYGNQVTFSFSTPPNLPLLTTTAISNNVYPRVTSGGNITSDGGSPITARGVVWSETSNPTLPTTKKTIDGTGTGSFISEIANLLTVPGSVINLRAYATNANGTSYGNQVTFTVSANPVDNSPALMTANINGVQYNNMVPFLYSFTGNDVIVENNGAPVGDPRYLKIQGDTSDTIGSLTEINFHIPNAKWVPGTYPLTETFDLGGSLLCQVNLVLPYIAGNPDFSTVTGGSITITEFNLTTKRIKGTFNITYQKGGLPTNYQITNGTFNYGLDASYFN